MSDWITQNLATILISLVLIAVCTLIIIKMRRDKKKGKTSCGCGCANCAMSGMCHSQANKPESPAQNSKPSKHSP